ncbi:hypothetical protein, partial [Pseudomonas aeruginosa]|uniref:hypothetical protein n=1 Tax=Pseudomonas aeruginosa TaxID=287 RepID=UPI001FABD4DA
RARPLLPEAVDVIIAANFNRLLAPQYPVMHADSAERPPETACDAMTRGVRRENLALDSRCLTNAKERSDRRCACR